MASTPRTMAWLSLTGLLALDVVGLVSTPPTLLRHVVQTLPFWVPILVGWRGSRLAAWAALPLFVFWLGIVTLIWLFLLGLARVVSGHFNAAEVTMTVVLGLACLTGLARGGWRRSGVPWTTAVALVAGMAVFQLAAFRISLLP